MRSAFNSYQYGIIMETCPRCGAVPKNRCRVMAANPAHRARTLLKGWIFDLKLMELIPVTQPYCKIIERKL